jgi:hypothetical protein
MSEEGKQNGLAQWLPVGRFLNQIHKSPHHWDKPRDTEKPRANCHEKQKTPTADTRSYQQYEFQKTAGTSHRLDIHLMDPGQA